jgi:tetratricopeptide (TPR) repeat protein
MHNLLSRFFDLALTQVHFYEGTINQFLGDGFMALFGAPVAHEDHARRAVLAALGLQRALGALNDAGDTGDSKLHARIGLNTGPVMVGKIGDNLRMDYTAVGDTTNIAARLQDLAEAGSIVISETSRQPVAELVKTEPLGQLQLKGTSTPVVAHRLIALRAGRSASESANNRRLSTFVGRQAELAALNARLAQIERGHGAAVGIVSEPGMGKSRLLLEFQHGIRDRRLTYLEARCLSYGTAIPYLLVLDVLRSNCSILDTDLPEVVARKVRSALEEVGMNADEDSPYLLHILGIKNEPTSGPWESLDAIKTNTFRVLRELSLRGSHRRPLILALEDLHWIDKTSEEFFDLLSASLPGAPILVLSTYRQGYSPPWIGRSYTTQIALEPLTADDGLALVESLERSVPSSIASIVVEKADGNPFFLEELARAVTEFHSLASPVPDTIQAVVSARIDRLPDTAKHLLQTASVIGREVPLSLLEAVSDGPGAVEVNLQVLTRSEFMYDRLTTDEPVYIFRHVLMQEVAYASLPETRRRIYHGAIGVTLERVNDGHTDRVVELLAHHFVRSNDKERGVDYCLRAAEKAQRRSGHIEALAFFDSALQQLDGMPQTEANTGRRIDAVVRQAEVKFALGRHAQHITALEGIRDLIGRADGRRRASWHFWLSFLHSLTGTHPTLAIAECRIAIDIAKADGFDDILASAECCLAQVLTVAGDMQAALDFGEHALSIFETQRNAWWTCRTLWIVAAAATARGEWTRALGYYRRALEYGQSTQDVRLIVNAWWRTAGTLVARGDIAGGLEYCRTALSLSPSPFDLTSIKGVQGYCRVKAGEIEAGIPDLEEAVASSEGSGVRYNWSHFSLRLSEAYLRLGHHARARALLEGILAGSRESGYRYHEGIALRLLGEVLMPTESELAVGYLDQALEVLSLIGARNDLAVALAAKGQLRRISGNHAEARDLLQRSLALFEELGTLDGPPAVRAMLSELGS